MILKIKSAKGQEHFLPSKTKAMEGTAERDWVLQLTAAEGSTIH